LKEWELTPLIKEVREKHPEIDFDKQRRIEKEVSNYIQDKFSFVVFRMDDKEKRLKFESKIISTLSSCDLCNSSSGWLGLNSPKEKIRSGGLWLVNEVNKGELSDEEMAELRDILQS
jgi:hypothetical protein